MMRYLQPIVVFYCIIFASIAGADEGDPIPAPVPGFPCGNITHGWEEDVFHAEWNSTKNPDVRAIFNATRTGPNSMQMDLITVLQDEFKGKGIASALYSKVPFPSDIDQVTSFWGGDNIEIFEKAWHHYESKLPRDPFNKYRAGDRTIASRLWPKIRTPTAPYGYAIGRVDVRDIMPEVTYYPIGDHTPLVGDHTQLSPRHFSARPPPLPPRRSRQMSPPPTPSSMSKGSPCYNAGLSANNAFNQATAFNARLGGAPEIALSYAGEIAVGSIDSAAGNILGYNPNDGPLNYHMNQLNKSIEDAVSPYMPSDPLTWPQWREKSSGEPAGWLPYHLWHKWRNPDEYTYE